MALELWLWNFTWRCNVCNVVFWEGLNLGLAWIQHVRSLGYRSICIPPLSSQRPFGLSAVSTVKRRIAEAVNLRLAPVEVETIVGFVTLR